jgi:hypothetical protein
LKVVGTTITAYWKPVDTTAVWIPLGSWTTAKNGTAFGLSSWQAGAEFDQLNVYPVS